MLTIANISPKEFLFDWEEISGDDFSLQTLRLALYPLINPDTDGAMLVRYWWTDFQTASSSEYIAGTAAISRLQEEMAYSQNENWNQALTGLTVENIKHLP